MLIKFTPILPKTDWRSITRRLGHTECQAAAGTHQCQADSNGINDRCGAIQYPIKPNCICIFMFSHDTVNVSGYPIRLTNWDRCRIVYTVMGLGCPRQCNPLPLSQAKHSIIISARLARILNEFSFCMRCKRRPCCKEPRLLNNLENYDAGANPEIEKGWGGRAKRETFFCGIFSC